MPDISMCDDDLCPAKASCHRHEASGTRPTQGGQWYNDFARPKDAERCGSYVKAERAAPSPAPRDEVEK